MGRQRRSAKHLGHLWKPSFVCCLPNAFTCAGVAGKNKKSETDQRETAMTCNRTLMAMAAASALFAMPVFAAQAPDAPLATIWHTDQFTIHSNITGHDYLIQVSKPDLPAGATTPALYLTDGNVNFGLVSGIAWPESMIGHDLEPAFIVGIGYPVSSIGDWFNDRIDDLTPVPVKDSDLDPKVPTGGSALFLRFIDEELRPRLQATYAIDPNRAILAGHSLGGLFAAYVLLNHPDDFQGYIITSPSLWADPALLTAALTLKAPLPVQVFLAVGTGETVPRYAMIENTQAFAKNLVAANTKVNVKLWVMSGEDHGSVPPAAMPQALKFVLPPKPH
jgi:predicted alpha/beta superfamily hydrolase